MTEAVAKKPDASGQLHGVAAAVQRLAVLLSAGVPPASAWTYLAEASGAGGLTPAPVLCEIDFRICSGEKITDAILVAASAAPSSEASAWRGLGAAWFVATEAGAPLAQTLHEFAASLRDLAQTQRDVQVALAAPTATARMVMALPVVGLLFGLVLGFDTLGTLFTTPPGLVCLALGVVMMLAARAWNRRLVLSARPKTLTPGLVLDLVAIAVSGGASIERALATVETAKQRYGVGSGEDSTEVDGVLALAIRAGVPAALLLRSGADENRRAARSDGEKQAATLSVKLMLPLGLLILPAFMLLGVAPLLIAVISSTVVGM